MFMILTAAAIAAAPAATAPGQPVNPAHEAHANMAGMKGAMPCHAGMMGDGKSKPDDKMDCCNKMSGKAGTAAPSTGK